MFLDLCNFTSRAGRATSEGKKRQDKKASVALRQQERFARVRLDMGIECLATEFPKKGSIRRDLEKLARHESDSTVALFGGNKPCQDGGPTNIALQIYGFETIGPGILKDKRSSLAHKYLLSARNCLLYEAGV